MVASIWHILLELAPWLFVGALVGGALHVLLPADFLRRHLSGRWGVLKAALLGVPMPLCSCSVIPAGLGLKKQGASDGATVAFMISTPQTGADAVFVVAGFLGLPFALFSLASTFVLGVVGGLWVDAGRPAPPAVEEVSLPGCDVPVRGRIRTLIDYALMLLRSIWRWLVVGIVASAAIEQFVPPGSLESLAGGGGWSAMLLALVIGVPLYVCTTASVPIAAALVHNGFPPGAALVFLIVGAATNVATIGAIYRAMGPRTLAKYLTTIVVGSVAFGVLFNLFIDPTTTAPAPMHEHVSWWAAACAAALVALLAWFAWEDAVLFWQSRRRPDDALAADASAARRIEVAVAGMTCGSCTTRLERVIGREVGVSSVAVTLEPARAVVTGNVSDQRVRELVAEAGFQPQ